jgi:hypothetical protein
MEVMRYLTSGLQDINAFKDVLSQTSGLAKSAYRLLKLTVRYILQYGTSEKSS